MIIILAYARTVSSHSSDGSAAETDEGTDIGKSDTQHAEEFVNGGVGGGLHVVAARDVSYRIPFR